MNKRSPSLLIVDDEVDICSNYADILTDMGYAVDVAHAGRPALENVRERAYDVALLDLKMPDMDGLTLYREIKKLRAGTASPACFPPRVRVGANSYDGRKHLVQYAGRRTPSPDPTEQLK